MSSIHFPELFVLALSRVPLFLGCRKYLLRSLYSDLQTISSGPPLEPQSPPTPSHSQRNGSLASIELDTLPLPASAGLTPSKTKFAPNDAASMHAAVSRNAFSLVFTESSMLFFVLMLQGIEMFTPSARLYSWKFSLIFLMALILVLIPLCISFVLAIGTKPAPSTSPRRLSSSRLLFGLLVVSLYLFLFAKIPLPSALSNPTTSTFTSTLSRLIVLGTIILGLLSGFGAVSNSWSYIPRFGRRGGSGSGSGIPTEEDVRAQEYALQSVKNDLEGRRAARERQASAAKAESSWFSRVGSSLRGGDSLTQELRGLEALEYQMTLKVEAMKARRDDEMYKRTFRGRIWRVGGYLFAAYCLLRVASSIVNVVLPSRRSSPGSDSSTSYPDIVAEVLASLLSHMSSTKGKISTEEIVLFARHISLVLVGVIILTSVRRVLGGVTRALRVTSRSLGASLMLLFLAQLMGIYLLSTIVQLRNTFPPVPSSHSTPPGELDPNPDATNNLFSTIPQFVVFGSLFDWSFLIAAGVSAIGRWGAERVAGVDDM